MNFNGANMNGHNVTITAGLANLNAGVDTLKVGLSSVGAVPTFTVNNYTTTDLFVNGTDTLGSTAFIDNAIPGAPAPTVDIAGFALGDNLVLGNVGVGIGPATVQINAAVGVATAINTNGGLDGWIDMGGTNVMTVDASHAVSLLMEDPGTYIGTALVPFVVNGGSDLVGGVVTDANLLQGGMGTVVRAPPGTRLSSLPLPALTPSPAAKAPTISSRTAALTLST